MTKNNHKLYLSVSLLIFPFIVAKAQMINKGEVIIEKGTNNVSTFFDFMNEKDATFINNDDFYVMKDFINKGSVSHDNEGTTHFKEINKDVPKKQIVGEGDTYLYNVVFNSPVSDNSDNAAFDLYGAINIEAQSNFKDGIVNNRETKGHFTFTENGTPVGTFDESYVNGKVEKLGNTSFPEFPIGAYKTEQYRFAGISAPSDMNHLVTAEYFLENSDPIYSHQKKDVSINSINNNEYWEITGTQNLILTLSWDDDTTPNEFLNNPQAIHITRWDESLKKWRDLGGVVDESSKTVSTPVIGEGIFTLALVDRERSGEDLEIFNVITPNGDNLNENFYVEFKEGTKVNKLGLKVYNRWGVLVYESDKYQSDKNINTFNGYSNGRMVIGKDNTLPVGTYFYVLDYDFTTIGDRTFKGKKVGYLYIAKDINFID